MKLSEYRHLKQGQEVWTDCEGLLKFAMPGIVQKHIGQFGCKWAVRINLFGEGFIIWEPEEKKRFLQTVYKRIQDTPAE